MPVRMPPSLKRRLKYGRLARGYEGWRHYHWMRIAAKRVQSCFRNYQARRFVKSIRDLNAKIKRVKAYEQSM